MEDLDQTYSEPKPGDILKDQVGDQGFNTLNKRNDEMWKSSSVYIKFHEQYHGSERNVTKFTEFIKGYVGMTDEAKTVLIEKYPKLFSNDGYESSEEAE